MKIEYDNFQDEYYLKFLDSDDKFKKSKYLKLLSKNNVSIVTMSIDEDSTGPTKSQLGMYRAFLILLEEYTGYPRSEIKELVYKNTKTSEEEINNKKKKEFSDFIEKLYQMCSENIGIEVQLIDNKLQIVKNG